MTVPGREPRPALAARARRSGADATLCCCSARSHHYHHQSARRSPRAGFILRETPPVKLGVAVIDKLAAFRLTARSGDPLPRRRRGGAAAARRRVRAAAGLRDGGAPARHDAGRRVRHPGVAARAERADALEPSEATYAALLAHTKEKPTSGTPRSRSTRRSRPASRATTTRAARSPRCRRGGFTTSASCGTRPARTTTSAAASAPPSRAPSATRRRSTSAPTAAGTASRRTRAPSTSRASKSR